MLTAIIFFFLIFFYTLNRIIECIGKYCIQVNHRYTVKIASIYSTRQTNPLVMADQPFFCKNRIQYLIICLYNVIKEISRTLRFLVQFFLSSSLEKRKACICRFKS